MRLLFKGPEGERELSITGGLPTSVGELAQMLGLSHPVDGLWIDDQWADADRRLDETGIAEGASVGVRPIPGPDPPGKTVEVVGGLCAGQRRPVPPDGLSLGRSPDADVTLVGVGLRPQHARIEYRDHQVVAQMGDEDPVALELSTPHRLGSVLIQVSDAPDDCPNRLSAVGGRSASGRVAFNRPPRPVRPLAREVLSAPSEEPRRSPRTLAFGWAALAGPLLVGLLMAVLYSPYMALFALLSPLMMGRPGSTIAAETASTADDPGGGLRHRSLAFRLRLRLPTPRQSAAAETRAPPSRSSPPDSPAQHPTLGAQAHP